MCHYIDVKAVTPHQQGEYEVIITKYNDFIGSHKQAHLTATYARITEVLGFEPQEDLCEKVTMQWDFQIGDELFSIWDYKGAKFSAFGNMAVLKELFGAENIQEGY